MAISQEELLQQLLAEATDLKYKDGKLDGFKKRMVMITKKIFGDSSDYLNTIDKTRFSPSITFSNMDQSIYLTTFESGKRGTINTLNVMIEDLALTKDLKKPSIDSLEVSRVSNKIFIVHGHNEEMKQSVARFAEKIMHEPIILHEQASKGKTIIEKFTDNSDVSFAIVLLSADDIGIVKNGDLSNGRLRARQNVIFELGFFLGKLGREKVVVLHETVNDFEFPSDYQGVLYIPFDPQGNWRFAVLKEMRATGHIVDANALI